MGATIQWAQQGINQFTSFQVDEDGVMGSQTINALNNLTLQQMKDVNNYIVRQRFSDIKKQPISNQIKFGYGWKKRFEKSLIK